MGINKKKYEYWGQWKQPLLSCWFWMKWNKVPSLKELNIHNIRLYPFLYLDGHFWIERVNHPQFLKMAEYILKKGEAEEYAKIIDKVFEKHKKEYLKILTISSKNPHEYVKHLFDLSVNMVAIWSFITFFTESLGEITVKNGVVSSDKELLGRVQNIASQTWIEKQNSEIKDIAKTLKSLGLKKIALSYLAENNELKSKIQKHVKEFNWIGSHHWRGEGYNIKKCLNQINKAIEDNRKVQTRKKASEDNSVIKLIAKGAYWRTHCAELTDKVVYESRNILESMGNLIGLKYEELIYLSEPEILSINKNSNVNLLKKKINDRKNIGYGCLVTDDDIEIVTSKKLKALILKMVDRKNDKNINEFSGVMASRGLIKGIVKIITSPDDFNKFKNGEILVAPETAPDFVPLMKKASAIITDLGGITSHAAIISRELNVPCIIGTKIATKVLKDGDLVEVDAEKGIIKVLKRN